MKKLAIGILIAMAIAFSLSSLKLPSMAQTSNQTNVTVEISAITKITVVPTNLTWYNVQPNSTGELKYLNIKNSGSLNITSVYAYVDTIDKETTNPIPTGDPAKYASTGLLLMNASTVNGIFYYVGRLDWNITPVGNGSTNKVDGPPGSYGKANSWGYFRRFDGDYLWNISLGNDIVINATHGCNSTGTVFMIEDDPDDGRPSTRQPHRSGGTVTSVADWGIFNITEGVLDGHCIAVHRTCEKIFIYKYDKRNGFGDCSAVNFVRDVNLTAGDQFTVYTTIWIPYGIPAGWLKSGWLTLEAWGS